VRWVWGEKRNVYEICWENAKGKKHLEYQDVVGRIKLESILKTGMAGRGLDLSGSEERQMAGCYKRGNESRGLIKCGKFV
jgi:hypothetical protein